MDYAIANHNTQAKHAEVILGVINGDLDEELKFFLLHLTLNQTFIYLCLLHDESADNHFIKILKTL